MNTRRQLAYGLLVNVVTLILIFVIGSLYINEVDEKRARDERENDREWCAITILYDDYFQANPPKPDNPNSELLRRLAELYHERRETLGC